MNTLEDRLRDAYRAVGDIVRADTVPELRGLPARRTWPARHLARRLPGGAALVPLAAAAAVVAVLVGLTVAIPALISANRPGGAQSISGAYAGGQLPGGPPPRFFAELSDGGSYRLTIFDSATGAVTGHLAPPRGKIFWAVAPLGNDHTFVAEVAPVGSDNNPSYGPCRTWLYRFQLTAHGRPVGLQPLTVAPVAGWPTGSSLMGDSLTASADGSVIAYATEQCHRVGTIHQDGMTVGRYTGHVGIIKLATKSVSTWSFSSADWAGPASLSLSADGGQLAFINYDSSGSPPTGLYVLPTGSAPGPLTSHARLVIPGRSPQATALTPAGTVTFALTAARVPGKPSWRVTLGAYATATGQLIHEVKVIQPGGSLQNPNSITPDASRRYLLIYGLDNRVQELDLATGRLTTLPATAKALNQADSAAW